MNRKSFVWLSLVGGISLYLPSLNCQHKINYRVIALPQFLGTIGDSAIIHDIGLNYRKQIPEEAKEELLANLLLTDGKGQALSVNANNASIHSMLEEKIIQDFKLGKTVMIKGWVLSITEARQCALFSYI
jgi:hypothetical protein